MRRREFITFLGGAAAAWPLAARAQQPALPIIGLLRSTPAGGFEHIEAALRQGLNEEGFIEGRNVVIEYRYADNERDRLLGLASDLVQRQVTAIVANGTAARVTKTVTNTVPIVFVSGEDPVRSGLVDSLNRPSGNVTGVSFFTSPLVAKRMELLHELAPNAAVIAALLDPSYAEFEIESRDVEAAGRAIGRRVVVVKASSDREIDAGFTTIAQAGAGALLVGPGAYFTSKRHLLAALAARHAIPAMYTNRDYVTAGGLISYSTSFTDAYRQAGVYVGRILKGSKPTDLPVVQPTKFELVINLGTAKALGIKVPLTLQVAADQVIE
jgi:putative tryptophan/tyrosine transport system substrate-binding protein